MRKREDMQKNKMDEQLLRSAKNEIGSVLNEFVVKQVAKQYDSVNENMRPIQDMVNEIAQSGNTQDMKLTKLINLLKDLPDNSEDTKTQCKKLQLLLEEHHKQMLEYMSQQQNEFTELKNQNPLPLIEELLENQKALYEDMQHLVDLYQNEQIYSQKKYKKLLSINIFLCFIFVFTSAVMIILSLVY